MIFGEWLTATIALGASVSGEVNLGRDYDYLNVQLPSMDYGTLNISVAELTGGTFRDLDPTVLIPASSGNYSDTWEIGGFQFIKIKSSANQTSARSIRVRGCRE